MTDFRKKFIVSALQKCNNNLSQLTDWEKNFIADITWLVKNRISLKTHQYNKLMDIKEKII